MAMAVIEWSLCVAKASDMCPLHLDQPLVLWEWRRAQPFPEISAIITVSSLPPLIFLYSDLPTSPYKTPRLLASKATLSPCFRLGPQEQRNEMERMNKREHPCWLIFPRKSNPNVKGVMMPDYCRQRLQVGWALLPPEHLSSSHVSRVWILAGLRRNSLIVRSSHGAPEPK